MRNGTGYKKKGKKEYRKEATYKYALLKAKSLITLKISCRISPCVVHYSYELRWPSSDNTLKEPDASGSFYYRF